jgi:hypothetical protein
VKDRESNQPGGGGEFSHERLDTEWATLSAIREMLGVALKGEVSPTYSQSLAFAKVIAPGIFDSERSVLGKDKEQEIVQEYKQRAQAMSALEREGVTPLQVVEREITQFERMKSADDDLNLIEKRLHTLYNIRSLLQPKQYREDKLILRDVYKASRQLPVSGDGADYRQFTISKQRALRLRVLHPDPPEHATGADLVYELYWEKKSRVRIALIQYKVWDGATLYSSQARNLVDQMSRLTSTICAAGLCDAPKAGESKKPYRMPYCSAFIRPTDKLQDPDTRLVSSGLHLPVCVASGAWEETGRGGSKIGKNRIRSQSLSHRVFEEMFNVGLLGSRWLSYAEIEELYRKHGILSQRERIVLHAQEFGIR